MQSKSFAPHYQLISLHFFVFILLQLIFCPVTIFAESLPLKHLSLRLVQTSQQTDTTPVMAKIVEIDQNAANLKLSWLSLTKGQEASPEGETYPTYKVRAARGVLEVDGFENKTGLLHPHLWAEGYVRLSDSLPLWIDPKYLELKGKRTLPFHIGLINTGQSMLQAIPDPFYEGLVYFQNLFEHYVHNSVDLRGENIPRVEKEKLKAFAKGFLRVGLVAKTEAKMFVNDKPTVFSAKIIGNDYYHLVVLDEPTNPLVIAFRILTENSPKVFERSFGFLKKNFEFQVRQVSY